MFAETIHKQRDFFQTGKTKEIHFRIQQLETLKQAIIENEAAIFNALKADLNKPLEESFTGEIVLVVKEIEYAINRMKKLE